MDPYYSYQWGGGAVVQMITLPPGAVGAFSSGYSWDLCLQRSLLLSRYYLGLIQLKVADAPGAIGAVRVSGYSPFLFMWLW